MLPRICKLDRRSMEIVTHRFAKCQGQFGFDV